MNSAVFALFRADVSTEGPIAWIHGNTIPGDVTKFGTMAEGTYRAWFQGRASYLKQGIDDTALLINGGNDTPTLFGNPSRLNPIPLTNTYDPRYSSAIFFHWGNYGQPRLTYSTEGGGIGYISKACQTSVHGAGSRPIHNQFMEKVGRDFNGKYHLTNMSEFNYPGPYKF